MKLSEINKALEEKFALQSYRDDHFRRHVTKTGKPKLGTLQEYPDALAFKLSDIPRKDLYDELADKLARTPRGGNILGYIDKNGRCQKYNKDTGEFTSYTVDSAGNPVNITYFPMKPEGWERNKSERGKHPYKEKLTPEKDAKPL